MVRVSKLMILVSGSVTSMVQKLGELGYLNYEKYRGLVLTEKEKKIACKIQKRPRDIIPLFFSAWCGFGDTAV